MRKTISYIIEYAEDRRAARIAFVCALPLLIITAGMLRVWDYAFHERTR